MPSVKIKQTEVKMATKKNKQTVEPIQEQSSGQAGSYLDRYSENMIKNHVASKYQGYVSNIKFDVDICFTIKLNSGIYVTSKPNFSRCLQVFNTAGCSMFVVIILFLPFSYCFSQTPLIAQLSDSEPQLVK